MYIVHLNGIISPENSDGFFDDFFINQNIRIFGVIEALVHPAPVVIGLQIIDPSVALLLNFSRIEGDDVTVIEFEPLIFLALYITIVMAELSLSYVDDYPLQFVDKVFLILGF